MAFFRKPKHDRNDPEFTLSALRNQIKRGGRPSLDDLSDEEMSAAATLISLGEAKIGSAACRPILMANLR